MNLLGCFILLYFLFLGNSLFAQKGVQTSFLQSGNTDSTAKNGDAAISISIKKTDSTKVKDSGILKVRLYNFSCKGKLVRSEFTSSIFPHKSPVEQNLTTPAIARFLTVHGNILYNFSYRSFVDTPFTQRDLRQHLVQTTFNFLIKGLYPVRMTVSGRYNNSPFFTNATDVNFQFNQNQMLGAVKADVIKKVEGLVSKHEYELAQQMYTEKLKEITQLETWVRSPGRLQEIVEESERNGRNSLPSVKPSIQSFSRMKISDWQSAINTHAKKISQIPSKNYSALFLKRLTDSVKNEKQTKLLSDSSLKGKYHAIEDTLQKKIIGMQDSIQKKGTSLVAPLAAKKAFLDSTAQRRYNSAKIKLDSLKKELKEYDIKIKKIKKVITDSVLLLKGQVAALSTSAGLIAFMKKHKIAQSEMSKTQKLLLSINHFGIGKTWVDYSDLTVKNISLTGMNIEMNAGKIYFAAAAGKINYRFRDFVSNKNDNSPDQSLGILRVGLGNKDGNNLIATFYNGKKSLSGNFSDSGNANTQRVLGLALEGRFSLNENNCITAEIAKSSFGNTGSHHSSFTELIGKATDFKIKTNYAYSIKLVSSYPQTDTKITGFYRFYGKDFQSFNLLPANVKTEAWMFKLNQYFFNKRICADVSIKKNDFSSAFANPSFSNQTVFKSFQVSLRVPKYPFVSVGFFPTSQLSLSNSNILTESQYNTFNAVMSYSYQIRKAGMNTNALYTRFYNTSADTGFVYFNATSWSVNQSFFIHPFSLQSGISMIDQSKIHLFTIEQMIACQIKNVVNISGSFKWNRLNHSKTLLGGTFSLGVSLRKIGNFQFNYDKTFLPGYNRELVPVDIGRMTFYREF